MLVGKNKCFNVMVILSVVVHLGPMARRVQTKASAHLSPPKRRPQTFQTAATRASVAARERIATTHASIAQPQGQPWAGLPSSTILRVKELNGDVRALVKRVEGTQYLIRYPKYDTLYHSEKCELKQAVEEAHGCLLSQEFHLRAVRCSSCPPGPRSRIMPCVHQGINLLGSVCTNQENVNSLKEVFGADAAKDLLARALEIIKDFKGYPSGFEAKLKKVRTFEAAMELRPELLLAQRRDMEGEFKTNATGWSATIERLRRFQEVADYELRLREPFPVSLHKGQSTVWQFGGINEAYIEFFDHYNGGRTDADFARNMPLLLEDLMVASAEAADAGYVLRLAGPDSVFVAMDDNYVPFVQIHDLTNALKVSPLTAAKFGHQSWWADAYDPDDPHRIYPHGNPYVPGEMRGENAKDWSYPTANAPDPMYASLFDTYTFGAMILQKYITTTKDFIKMGQFLGSCGYRGKKCHGVTEETVLKKIQTAEKLIPVTHGLRKVSIGVPADLATTLSKVLCKVEERKTAVQLFDTPYAPLTSLQSPIT